MDPATELVLVIGLLFFGSTIFLAWREQKRAKPQDTRAVASAQPNEPQTKRAARHKRRAA